MALLRANVAPDTIEREPLPFRAGDEGRRHPVQSVEHLRVGGRGRVFHRQDLDRVIAYAQVVTMTLEGGIGDKVVEIAVVLEARVRRRPPVIAQAAHELEDLLAIERRRVEDIGQQDGARLRLRQELVDSAVQLRVDVRLTPGVRQCLPGSRPPAKAPADPLVQQHQVVFARVEPSARAR